MVDGVTKNHVVGDTIRVFDQTASCWKPMGRRGARLGHRPYGYNGVSDVLQAPNGDIFVADGHDPDGNARVIKYDRNGNSSSMGSEGNGPTDFNPPHGLAMDKEGRLYVADRGNGRSNAFDQNGKLLDVWTQFGQPSGVFVDKNDILYVAKRHPIPRTSARLLSPASAWPRSATARSSAYIPWPEDGTLEGVAVADDGTIYGGYTNIPGAHRFLKN